MKTKSVTNSGYVVKILYKDVFREVAGRKGLPKWLARTFSTYEEARNAARRFLRTSPLYSPTYSFDSGRSPRISHYGLTVQKV